MSIAKTERGLKVMKDRSVPLTPRQRSVFILVDGRRTLEDLLAASAALGATREDIEKLFELGLVARAAAPASAAPGPAPVPSPAAAPVVAPAAPVAPATAGQTDQIAQPAGDGDARTPAQRYQEAYLVASQLTASLGLRGFRLNLAVEAARSYEDLLALAPRIRDAVGPEKYAALGRALGA